MIDRRRKYIRLPEWDYSSEGTYFITICCKDRQSYFGKINDNEMILSKIGLIATQYWSDIPNHFSHVKLDDFVIMPNHIHGILILDYTLVGSCHGMTLQSHHNVDVGTRHGVSLPNEMSTPHGVSLQMPHQHSGHNINQFSKPVKNSISVIINQYKSSIKRWCNKNGIKDFQWQSRFYDQVLHDQDSISNIREYIFNNPKNWSIDELFN
jgi:hypothetical protein